MLHVLPASHHSLPAAARHRHRSASVATVMQYASHNMLTLPHPTLLLLAAVPDARER
jgi:hypothetical protein